MRAVVVRPFQAFFCNVWEGEGLLIECGAAPLNWKSDFDDSEAMFFRHCILNGHEASVN
jgi:hypothetical protein